MRRLNDINPRIANAFDIYTLELIHARPKSRFKT